MEAQMRSGVERKSDFDVCNASAGSSCMNDQLRDARVLARAVMIHATSVPHLSLCVRTVSLIHAERIWGILQKLRKINAHAEKFFANHINRPFFIDTRDSVADWATDVVYESDF